MTNNRDAETYGSRVVTVIVLSYNNIDKIYRALDSILRQTYPHIEVIVGDDGSPDFDETVIKNRIQARNRGNIVRWEIVRSEKNQGTVANLYGALTRFTGNYYITIGADDELFCETTIEDYMDIFRQYHYEPYLVTGNAAMYDFYMKKFLKSYISTDDFDLLKTRDPDKIFGRLAHTCFLSTVATCYSRRFLDKVGMPDREYHILEDWTTFHRMVEKGITPVPLEKFTAKHAAGGIANGNIGGNTDIYKAYYRDKEKMWERYVIPRLNELSDRDRTLFFRRMKFEKNRLLRFTDYTKASKAKKLLLCLSHPSLLHQLLIKREKDTDNLGLNDYIFALLSGIGLILLWNMKEIKPFFKTSMKIGLFVMGSICAVKFGAKIFVRTLQERRIKKGIDLY